MTASRKQLELLQLAASVQSLKSAFNGRFAALRSLKVGAFVCGLAPQCAFHGLEGVELGVSRPAAWLNALLTGPLQVSIIAEVKQLNARLREVNTALGISGEPPDGCRCGVAWQRVASHCPSCTRCLGSAASC
jgi:hypothetical protein